MSSSFIADTRGASETVGYVLLISVVFFSVLVVMGAGAPTMNDKQQSVYMQNVERAFETYSDNIDDSVFNLAPARSTVLKLDGGRLFDNSSTTMNVSVVNETGVKSSYPVYSTPVVYEKDEVYVAYEYGAVIMGSEDGGGIIQDPPPFTFSDNMVSLPVIATSVPSSQAGSSFTGKVTIVGRERGMTTHQMSVDDDTAVDSTVYVNVSSPRYSEWSQYFENEGLTHVETVPSEQFVSYKHETDDVFLKEVVVHVSSSR